MNNTDENLSVLNRKEHSLETKKKQRKPFIGDPSLGVELHFLSEAVNTPNGKKHFRLKINGIPFKAMSDDMEGHLRKWIADEIMNRNASDEQIFAYLLSAGYRDRDFITDIIGDIRKYVRVPDPSVIKRKKSKSKKVKQHKKEKVEMYIPLQLIIDRVIE